MRFNPRHRDLLTTLGLASAGDFLALPGVVVSGHPDRHVMRVTVGHGEEARSCFLKREHRIRWRGRLANACSGFGWASKSCREAALLHSLQRAGVPCAEWLAAGEDGKGRAFLLVREIVGAVELRVFLQGAVCRQRLAEALGRALAHMHDAGFTHGDLYAKHVLVTPRDLGLYFLDWQRARYEIQVAWPRRWLDLAALHATLCATEVSPRERLGCLRAYLKASVPGRTPLTFRREAVRLIDAYARRLLRRRHVREARDAPLEAVDQRLLWLDGEALCVTPEFHAALGRQSWLPGAALLERGRAMREATVALPGMPHARLVRRRADWSPRRLWSWLCGSPVASREMRQAGLLFRLQRHGIPTPRLLAFGQKHYPPRRTESFLLTETPARAVSLAAWLAAPGRKPLWSAERQQRRRLLRDAGALLRRLHDARCYLGPRANVSTILHVSMGSVGAPIVVLGSVGGVITRRRSCPRQAILDLARLRRISAFTRADWLRVLLAYARQERVTPEVRRLARTIAQTLAWPRWAALLVRVMPPPRRAMP